MLHGSLCLSTHTKENEHFLYNSGKKNRALFSKFNFLAKSKATILSNSYLGDQLITSPSIKACFKISNLVQFRDLVYLMTILTVRRTVESILKFSFLCFEGEKWRLCSHCFLKELNQPPISMRWNPCVFIPLSRIHLHNNSGWSEQQYIRVHMNNYFFQPVHQAQHLNTHAPT